VFLELTLAAALQGASPGPVPQESSAAAEERIVAYLKENAVPGRPLVVSTLFNEVFTSPVERRALNRLFNTFFKIPLFVAQFQKARGKAPTLAELSEQFAFAVPGQADVLLRVMETDPRVPRFLKRDPKTGEILGADVDAILAHPRFGKSLERTITGWEGNPAPAFSATGFDGTEVSLAKLLGRPFVVYFWFTNCPPCVTTAPKLVEMSKKYESRGVAFVGLNADRLLELDTTDEDRAAYLAKIGMTFPQAHATADVQNAFGGVSVFPTIFVVDKDGVVARHLVNAPEAKALDAAIAGVRP
jgi:thiol-disulfide isomerase/thioredoxin